MEKYKKDMIVAVAFAVIVSIVLGLCCMNSVGKLIKAQFVTHQEVVIEKLFCEEHHGRWQNYAEVCVDNATQKVYISGSEREKVEEGDTLEVVFVDDQYCSYESIKSLAGNNVGVTCMMFPFAVASAIVYVIKGINSSRSK